jgi:signal recognition particle GTPase
VGVGEGVEDLQPFDAEAFVNALFSWGKSASFEIMENLNHGD